MICRILQPGVKIAISGKGGVGKTTVCAWLFAKDGLDVLAVDADSDPNPYISPQRALSPDKSGSLRSQR